jgi:hypothetical protein
LFPPHSPEPLPGLTTQALLEWVTGPEPVLYPTRTRAPFGGAHKKNDLKADLVLRTVSSASNRQSGDRNQWEGDSNSNSANRNKKGPPK